MIALIHELSATVAYAHIFRGQPFPTDQTRQRWREFGGHVRLAELAGRPVGFVAWQGQELDALYVLPEAAGLGVGSRLLDEAGRVSVLWVLEENHAGRQFYEHRGWRPDGASQVFINGAAGLRYRRQ